MMTLNPKAAELKAKANEKDVILECPSGPVPNAKRATTVTMWAPSYQVFAATGEQSHSRHQMYDADGSPDFSLELEMLENIVDDGDHRASVLRTLRDWKYVTGLRFTKELHEQPAQIVERNNGFTWLLDPSARRGAASTVEEAIQQVTEAAMRDQEWERDRDVAVEHGDMPDIMTR